MTQAYSSATKEKFAMVQELSRKGDLRGALPLMEELATENPNSGILRASLANLYWDLNDWENATHQFIQATTLSPTSEKISLGLFHCLWDQKRYAEALKEIERYMSYYDSEIYMEIVREINSKWELPETSSEKRTLP